MHNRAYRVYKVRYVTELKLDADDADGVVQPTVYRLQYSLHVNEQASSEKGYSVPGPHQRRYCIRLKQALSLMHIYRCPLRLSGFRRLDVHACQSVRTSSLVQYAR